MTTPYNTGKVSIGSRYTPRIQPTASQGFSGPYKRRFFDKPDRVVLSTCALAVAALAVILLAGCKQAGAPYEVPTTGPDEHGVVCYGHHHYAISCVKVLP